MSAEKSRNPGIVMGEYCLNPANLTLLLRYFTSSFRHPFSPHAQLKEYLENMNEWLELVRQYDLYEMHKLSQGDQKLQQVETE